MNEEIFIACNLRELFKHLDIKVCHFCFNANLYGFVLQFKFKFSDSLFNFFSSSLGKLVKLLYIPSAELLVLGKLISFAPLLILMLYSIN